MPEILIFVICIASYIFGVISLVQERKYLRGILALISGIILSIWFSLALYVSILRSNTTTYPIVDIVDPRTGLTTQYALNFYDNDNDNLNIQEEFHVVAPKGYVVHKKVGATWALGIRFSAPYNNFTLYKEDTNNSKVDF